MEERMGLMQIEKDALLKAKDKLVESCNDLKIKLVQKQAEIKAQKELNGLAPKADTIKPGHIQIATADLEMFKEGAAILKHLRGEHEELKRKSASSIAAAAMRTGASSGELRAGRFLLDTRPAVAHHRC